MTHDFLSLPETATTSRPHPTSKNTSKLRFNWFMMGALAGVGFSGAMNHITLPDMSDWSSEEVAAIYEDSATETAVAPINALAELPVETAPAEPAGPAYPMEVAEKVERGDTLIVLIQRHGVSYVDADIALKGLKGTFDPRNIREGQEISLTLDKPEGRETPIVTAMHVKLSAVKHVALTRESEGKYSAKEVKAKLHAESKRGAGVITSSLYQTAAAAGVQDGVIMELIKAYAYNVDLQRDIRSGDKMDVMYEDLRTESGELAGYGKIHYANLTLGGKEHKIYRYEDSKGHVGFYDEKGESIIRALLKTPVDGARISSGFGKRKHPILGYTKQHTGTDFAAPTGTPIFAAGDGVIAFKGRKGGYGNYIKIRHNDTYHTAYAHMSRYAKGMGNGTRVKQGQIIGYVGSTGRSTGPHLHYEVHKFGKKVNPMGEKFKTGRTLKGTELASFKSKISDVHTQLASMPVEKKVASAE